MKQFLIYNLDGILSFPSCVIESESAEAAMVIAEHFLPSDEPGEVAAAVPLDLTYPIHNVLCHLFKNRREWTQEEFELDMASAEYDRNDRSIR